MDERLQKITISAMLHDIGKVIYRQGDDMRKHSLSGYDFLKQRIGIEEKEILDGVKYHHYDAIKNSNLPDDSSAYIVYMADNIASMTDRRPSEDYESGFDVQTPLASVFNILNGNRGNMYYKPYILNETEGINYPSNEKARFQKTDYSKVLNDIADHLRGIELDSDYIESLLEILEADLSFIPSATSNEEIPDISLYDHMKMTAAYSGCIFYYLKDRNIINYKEYLFSKGKAFYDEEAFIIASIDLSGIQDFIYTISTKNALKTLRARSFYLEILMEYAIDVLLERLGLSRANLIYSGGGHCYILIPNTKDAAAVFDSFLNEFNKWMIKEFDISLYAAGGYAVCNAKALRNEPIGSYSEIFKTITKTISEKKSHKYSADDIMALNSEIKQDYSRECRVCHRMDNLDDDNVCGFCREIAKLSKSVLYEDFFAVTHNELEGLEFPFGGTLVCGDENTIRDIQAKDDKARIYGKNRRFSGKNLSTKLWVGNYTTGDTFEELADSATGINRIGVLRADVDNLGEAFVRGFENKDNNDRNVSLSRTATLSRQLSLFFKYYINDILEKPEYALTDGRRYEPAHATIVYSGGDDIFIVGAWDDIVSFSVDLKSRFKKFTEGTLSLSAGIGIYGASYPVQVIANEVGEMENSAKLKPGKNAVTLFDGNVFSFFEFEDKVIEEKYRCLSAFFDSFEEKGKNFLYNMLTLIRGQNERINFARLVYLMSRMEPPDNAGKEEKEHYREFSGRMIEWVQNDKDRKQLESAIILYVYSIRETEGIQ